MKKISIEKLAIDALVNHYEGLNPFLSWQQLTRIMYPNLSGIPYRAAVIQTKQRKFKIKELATENGYTLICSWNDGKTRIRGVKLAKIEDAQLVLRELEIMEKNRKARELSIERYKIGAKRYIEIGERIQKQQLKLEMV